MPHANVFVGRVTCKLSVLNWPLLAKSTTVPATPTTEPSRLSAVAPLIQAKVAPLRVRPPGYIVPLPKLSNVTVVLTGLARL